MNVKHKTFLFLAILGLLWLCGVIILGDKGLAELKLLKQEHQLMIEDNESMARKNLSFSSEIDRLQTDLDYIEEVAKQQLGFIGKDAFILKPNNSSDRTPQ